MPLTANIVLIVPDLPDASVWFANAAAWKDYWRNITAQVEFDAAENAIYVPQALDETIQYVAMNVNGNDHLLVPQPMFESLVARTNAMEAAFQNMRTAMKDAGFIEEAQ